MYGFRDYLPPCGRQPFDPSQFPTTQAPGGQTGGMPMFPLPVISPTGLPTGMPAGPTPAPMPAIPQAGMTPGAQPSMPQFPTTGTTPQTLSDVYYVPGFLRTQIGKKVRVDFLVGTSNMTDRTGTLVGVGASYILLRSSETNVVIMCDLYSIKFVTIFPSGSTAPSYNPQ